MKNTNAMIVFEASKGQPEVIYRMKFASSATDRIKRREWMHEVWGAPLDLWCKAVIGILCVNVPEAKIAYHRQKSFATLDFIRSHYSLHGGDVNSDWIATISFRGGIKFHDVSPQCEGEGA